MSRKRNSRRRTLETPSTTPTETTESVETPEPVSVEGDDEETPEVAVTEDVGDDVTDETEPEDAAQSTEAPDAEHLATTRELHNLPADWDDVLVRKWLSWWKQQPQNTRIFYEDDAGHRIYKFDPDRVTKPLGDWYNEEVRLWLEGQLVNPGNAELGAIVDEARRRWAVEPAWTDKQVVQYHRTGAIPQQTTNGVWVTDKTRPKRPAKEWATAELEAWLNKDITAVGEATEGRLAIEAKKRFQLKGEATSPEQIRRAYQSLMETDAIDGPVREESPQTDTPNTVSGTKDLPLMKATFLEDTLNRYAKDVCPGTVVSDAKGTAAQRALNSVFDFALKQEGNDFLAAMNAIKDFVTSQRDKTFAPSYVYRFTRSLPLSSKRRMNHINLIELFLLATDPNPAMRQQADYNRLTRGFQPATASKLLDYFRHYA